MKVVIDRNTWTRGRGGMNSRLLNNEGGKCCLGFAAMACGYSEEQIRMRVSPASLLRKLSPDVTSPDPTADRWPEGTFSEKNPGENSNVIGDMMRVNDARSGDTLYLYSEDSIRIENLTEQLRESKLKELAAKLGWEFEYVGGEEKSV